jgi:hypothetical protein
MTRIDTKVFETQKLRTVHKAQAPLLVPASDWFHAMALTRVYLHGREGCDESMPGSTILGKYMSSDDSWNLPRAMTLHIHF